MSDKVKYTKVERWGWDCPSCDHWNEEDDDPGYCEELFCEECELGFTEFKED